MRRHLGRRVKLLLALAAVAAFWAQPVFAFDAVSPMSRAVAADVVTDALAYNAIAGGSCLDIPLSGGTCTFTITNKATTGQNFTVTKQTDAESRINSYALTGATPVSSGPVTTPSEIAVGSTTTLTADIRGCLCGGQTKTITWKINGAQAGVLDSERTHYTMTIRYSL